MLNADWNGVRSPDRHRGTASRIASSKATNPAITRSLGTDRVRSQDDVRFEFFGVINSSRHVWVLASCITIFTALVCPWLMAVWHDKYLYSSTLNSKESASERSSMNTIPVGITVTIYTFDRPSDLRRLLEDIERTMSAEERSVRVHIVDDNSLGCVPSVPVSTNFFEEFDPSTLTIPISQLVPEPKNDAIKGDTVLAKAAYCSARSRFRAVEAIVERNVHHGWKLFSALHRHGRRRYWHLVHMALTLLRKFKSELDSEFFVFLPDDVRLSADFFARAIASWDSIQDPLKCTLMLHIEESRLNASVWTDVIPERVSDDLYRIGWVESGNFISDIKLLRQFNWSFPRVPIRRWKNNPPISSGVGAGLSETIHSMGYSMYRTHNSLVAHIGVRLSRMNSAFREKGRDYHLTLNFADGEDRYQQLLQEGSTVTASLASVWNRDLSLHASIDSLAHQVDHINVYLNGYDSVPAYLHVPYVTALLSQESPRGDIGDIGKFFWANKLDTEYHITVDDDIVYPDDYVAKLLRFLTNSLACPAVVGLHGIRIRHDDLLPLNGRKGNGYYGSRDVFMGTGYVSSVEGVHILGTGTIMYKVADIGMIDIDATFKYPNMADIWFGILGQKLSIPFVVIPHCAEWIKEFPGTSCDSLYSQFTMRRHADRRQTMTVISAAPWVVNSFTLGKKTDSCICETHNPHEEW